MFSTSSEQNNTHNTPNIHNTHSLFIRVSTPLIAGLILITLMSCQSSMNEFSRTQKAGTNTAQNINAFPEKTATAQGEILGYGSARIAFLIPRTAPGNGSVVANQLRNAAELAISDLGSDVMELVIKDTNGTPTGAITATQEAIKEGSAAVLGPVFSSSVTSARSIIAQSKRPLIGFSSDLTAAGPNAYLISFLPDQLVSRSINYALTQGKKTFAAIVPSGAYGLLVEQELRTTLETQGGNLLAITKYEYNNQSITTAIAELVEAAKIADVIFIPDGGNLPVFITKEFKIQGVDLSQKLLVGTGQWRTSDLKSPDLQNAIFADMDQTRFDLFKKRYIEKFNSEPTVNAALGYDAVLLIGGLLRERPGQSITREDIERRQGFIGASGIFRFLPNGLNQRGLAIFKVNDGQVIMIEQSPSFFAL